MMKLFSLLKSASRKNSVAKKSGINRQIFLEHLETRLVLSTYTVTNTSNSDGAAVSCGLTYGDRTSYQAADLSSTIATPRSATQELTLLVANTSAAAGPITVTCTRSAGADIAGAFDVTGLRIVATQTGNLTTIATN